jgi:hypothetical protein
MSNVLGDTTPQQILALGRLGWTLSRIQQMTGIRRDDHNLHVVSYLAKVVLLCSTPART